MAKANNLETYGALFGTSKKPEATHSTEQEMREFQTRQTDKYNIY